MLKGIQTQSIGNAEVKPFTTSDSVNVKDISLRDTSQKIVRKVKAMIPKKEIIVNPEDTSSTIIYNEILPYQHVRSLTDGLYNENFLLSIPSKSLVQHTDSTLSALLISKVALITEERQVLTEQKNYMEGAVRNESSVNWLPGVLILSFFVFSWVKMLYQKYVIQVITSSVNYQASIRLLRERNVLFRNMAVGLNFVFAINVGLFILFLIQFFGLKQVHQDNFISVVIYSLAVTLLYNIKTFFCKLVGYIFMVREEFSEYIHNIHLFNKNIGLLLFPIVIVFPYINDFFKPFVFYLGISVVILMLVLRTFRGIQIIMRKGVSTFYLILYLCAVEILPVLLLVKISRSLI
jgi:hypothetical protein